jgi:hypothetical protein
MQVLALAILGALATASAFSPVVGRSARVAKPAVAQRTAPLMANTATTDGPYQGSPAALAGRVAEATLLAFVFQSDLPAEAQTAFGAFISLHWVAIELIKRRE